MENRKRSNSNLKSKSFYCTRDNKYILVNEKSSSGKQALPTTIPEEKTRLGYFIEAPVLNPMLINEVYVTHIFDISTIYVQKRTQKFEDFIHNIQRLMLDTFNKKKPLVQYDTGTGELIPDKLYLTNHDNFWFRVTIQEAISADQVKVFFTDYGHSAIVKESMLFPLSKLDKTICNQPYQALKIRLAATVDASSCENIESNLRFILPLDKPVYIQVKQPGIEPIAELHIASKDALVDLKSLLEIRHAVEAPLTRDLSLIKTKYKYSLSPPDIPQPGMPFMVTIPLVNTPNDFIINRFVYQAALKALEANMNEYYQRHMHLRKFIPRVGQYCAGKDKTGKWRRMRFVDTKSNGLVVVHFSDHGDYEVINLRNIKPLIAEFGELPYQALEAKLKIKSSFLFRACDKFCKLVEDSVLKCTVKTAKLIKRGTFDVPVLEVALEKLVNDSYVNLKPSMFL